MRRWTIAVGALVIGLGAAAPAQAQAGKDTAAAQTAGTDEGPGEYRVDVGGYGSFRLEGSDAEEGEPAFTLRRFVVTTDAHLGGRFQIYSEVEYERLGEIEVEREAERDAGGVKFEQELEGTNGSELALEQAWAQMNLTPGFGLRFGAVLAPVGRFNLSHDDNLWNFPRRPLIDRAAQVLPGKAAWTEMGLGAVGHKDFASGARLEYQAFLLTGTTLDFALENVAQTRTAGVFWTHNDGGDPTLYAVDEHGAERGRVRMTGATLQDWEAIAAGPCPAGSCLYLADIGDNKAERASITLYRVPEPEPEPADRATAPAEAFHATYPDGPQDAEAIFALPNGAVYLVSKGETGPAGLYRFPQPFRPGSTVVLEKIAAISTEPLEKSERITAASASPDGRWVALRTLHSLVIYPADSVIVGRFTDPVEMDLSALKEPQGEGVALAGGGSVFLTSEAGGKNEPAKISQLACKMPG